MKKETVWKSKHFCGNEVSEYGQEHGWVDYATLAKSFDAVLANDLINKTHDIGYWEIENGIEYGYANNDGDIISESDYYELTEEEQKNYYEHYVEIYQYYVISAAGASILGDYTDEIVFYNEKLNLYVWGVTHWGTSWDYVLTDIRLQLD